METMDIFGGREKMNETNLPPDIKKRLRKSVNDALSIALDLNDLHYHVPHGLVAYLDWYKDTSYAEGSDHI